MREILFRGKTINSGEWIEGYLFENWGDAYICLGTENGNIMKEKVNPETVGQYTGIEDANGKKIFDGDIMEKGDFLYLVEWRNITIWLKPLDKWSIEHEARPTAMNMGSGIMRKVIGNIHDNPKLLEEER